MTSGRIGDACPHCPHSFDAHKIIAPGDPLQGGLTMCPVWHCTCWGTWDVRGQHRDGGPVEPEQPECGICFSAEHRPYTCPHREAFAREMMRRRDHRE